MMSARRVGPLALVTLAAACAGGGTPTDAASPALSVAQVDAAADVVLSDVAALADLSGGGVPNFGAAPGGLPSLALAASEGSTSGGTTPGAPGGDGRRWDRCLPSTSNAGGLGVVLRWEGCRTARPDGRESTVRSGSMTLTRTETAGSYESSVTYTDYLVQWTRRGRDSATVTTSERRNGVQSVRGTADSRTQSVGDLPNGTAGGFVTEFTGRDGTVSRHVRRWTTTFTADRPGTLGRDRDLPAGTWSFGADNTGSFTRDGRTWTVRTTTPTPLHFNPSCSGRPQLDAGVLRSVFTNREGRTTTVTTTFQPDCAAPVVTRE